MWEYMGGMMGSWMILWWAAGIVLLLIALWLLAEMARRTPAGPSDTAEDVLKRRYARGDIDRDEFERRLADLKR